MLPYNNTRHCYSWICSLRSKGAQTEHYCTVTLLSRPPRPTVVVESAHCTYLCKRDPDSPVPTCCCADGPENCADENSSCGETSSVQFPLLSSKCDGVTDLISRIFTDRHKSQVITGFVGTQRSPEFSW